MGVRGILDRHLVPVALASIFLIQPANACVVGVPLEINDARRADAVVIGRVSNYRIIHDLEFRKRMLANRRLSPELRKIYEGSDGVLSDYARFDVQVHEILAGKVPDRFSVTWDNSTFGEPKEMDPGPFLIALRRLPLSRSPNAKISPDQGASSLLPLQAPCSAPFIIPIADPRFENIRRVLTGQEPLGVDNGEDSNSDDPTKSKPDRAGHQPEKHDADRWDFPEWFIALLAVVLVCCGIVTFLRMLRLGGRS